jgi:dihydroorotase/N-acyl-D-amino-acid deacylase
VHATLALLVLLAPAAKPDFDLLISGGRIVDGSGAPWFRGDVGIKGDRIAAIGNLSQKTTALRIEAGDKMVAPGFIDMLGQSELAVLVDNRVESKIRQGITTEITGEGFSPGPVNDAIIAEMKPWLDRYRLQVDWRDLDGYFRRF